MTEKEIITEELQGGGSSVKSEFHTSCGEKTPRREKQKPARERKTGMFSLGISLILIGASALARNFTGNINISALINWSPVLLVILGAEILYGSFKDGEKYRVNFWCVVMCITLSAASMCAAIVPSLWDAWGPASRQREMRIEAEFADKCYEKLKNSGVTYLNGYLSLNGAVCETLSELDSSTGLYVDVRLSDYNSREEFVSAAMPVIKTVSTIVPKSALRNIDISGQGGDETYRLYLNSRWTINAGYAELLDQVTVTAAAVSES